MSGRVSTGIRGLDPLMGGGFPRGSLIPLVGNPGTKKEKFLRSKMTDLFPGVEETVRRQLAERDREFKGRYVLLTGSGGSEDNKQK